MSSFDELNANADKAKGKIVLYNVPFTTYGQTVAYRSQGADAAAAVREFSHTDPLECINNYERPRGYRLVLSRR